MLLLTKTLCQFFCLFLFFNMFQFLSFVTIRVLSHIVLEFCPIFSFWVLSTFDFFTFSVFQLSHFDFCHFFSVWVVTFLNFKVLSDFYFRIFVPFLVIEFCHILPLGQFCHRVSMSVCLRPQVQFFSKQQCQKPQTLPLLTPPLYKIAWLPKTDAKPPIKRKKNNSTHKSAKPFC